MKTHQPRKRFGQHFLTDQALINRLVNAIAPKSDQILVEIGPGEGALTSALLDEIPHLHAVELDRDLISSLEQRYSPERLTLHAGDALKFDFATLAEPGKQLRIVGNLPYNISTPVIFHLLEHTPQLQDMHFMLQKEVVDRLIASPGGGDWGRLSIMVQYHCQADFLFSVPPEAFRPPPRVNSAVVRLIPHAQIETQTQTQPPTAQDYPLFCRMVTQVFSQRRKTLKNGLKSFLDASTIQAVGIDPGLRPEQLSVADFVSLANAAAEQQP